MLGLTERNNNDRQAGIHDDVVAAAASNALVFAAVKKHPRDGWETAFDNAINTGEQPEDELFAGVENQFDKTEWTR